MSETVVIDASLAAMWALPEPHSQKALMLAHVRRIGSPTSAAI